MEIGGNFWIQVGELILSVGSFLGAVGIGIASRSYMAGAMLSKFVTREDHDKMATLVFTEIEKTRIACNQDFLRKEVATEKFNALEDRLETVERKIDTGFARLEDKLSNMTGTHSGFSSTKQR